MAKHHLSIYLLKERLHNLNDIFGEHIPPNTEILSDGGEPLGTFYWERSNTYIPRWATLFTEALDFQELEIFSASSKALLLIPQVERIFALSFGWGRSLLEQRCWEERFGFLVTLNSINPDSVYSIDKKSFDLIGKQSREQANRPASTHEFGVDIERDLLRSITGTPDDNTLGYSMSGMDALKVSIEIELSALPNLLSRYYERYLSTDYQQVDTLKWIDHLSEVKNSDLVERLDDLLLAGIKVQEPNITMAVPEIIEWGDFNGFLYKESLGPGDPKYSSLSIRDLPMVIRNFSNATINTIKYKKVCFVSAAQDAVTHIWHVYNCLNFELVHDGNVYALSNGMWYRIATDFTDEINRFINSIQPSAIEFPRNSNEYERTYNERMRDESAGIFALVDKENILHGGGRSKIEFCDLYSRSQQMIYVKKYSGSATLSHLFQQGFVSAQTFLLDESFREKVNNVLPSSHRLDDARARLNPSDFEIIYAIIQSSAGELRLPFFSKVSLANTARRLMGYGYSVYLNKIEVGAA